MREKNVNEMMQIYQLMFQLTTTSILDADTLLVLLSVQPYVPESDGCTPTKKQAELKSI